jgi:hypothetical protein
VAQVYKCTHAGTHCARRFDAQVKLIDCELVSRNYDPRKDYNREEKEADVRKLWGGTLFVADMRAMAAAKRRYGILPTKVAEYSGSSTTLVGMGRGLRSRGISPLCTR